MNIACIHLNISKIVRNNQISSKESVCRHLGKAILYKDKEQENKFEGFTEKTTTFWMRITSTESNKDRKGRSYCTTPLEDKYLNVSSFRNGYLNSPQITVELNDTHSEVNVRICC